MGDTAGQEEFDRIRYLSYRDTNVFFFCFSVVDKASFTNIQGKWLPEVKYHMAKKPGAKMILVGLKSDLRDDQDYLKKHGKEPVQDEEAKKWSKDNDMHGYMAVSALKGTGVEELFSMAVTQFLGPSNEEPKPEGGCSCTLL